MLTEFWWENIRERGNLKDQTADGRMTLKYIFKRYDLGSADWIGLFEDTEYWRLLCMR
jgi:hypothetical protein